MGIRGRRQRIRRRWPENGALCACRRLDGPKAMLQVKMDKAEMEGQARTRKAPHPGGYRHEDPGHQAADDRT